MQTNKMSSRKLASLLKKKKKSDMEISHIKQQQSFSWPGRLQKYEREV